MGDFYFVGQQIIDAKSREVREVELLLSATNKVGFPEQEFHNLLNSSLKQYQAYLKDLNNELMYLWDKYPTCQFSLNFTQQELEFPVLLTYLKSINTNMRARMMIEITEQAPNKKYTEYSDNINVSMFKKIHDLGYKIALDDIMQGNNSLGNFMLVRPYISRIKWSFTNGGHYLNQQQIYWIIKLLRSLTCGKGISLVVEGVEEEMISYWLLTMNVHQQQGFLFAKPAKL